jgi:hypothetical protein
MAEPLNSANMPLGRESTRRDDKVLFKVTREIPLPFLIAALIGFAGQAVALYYNQQSLATQLLTQSSDIKILGTKIDSILDKRNEDIVKDLQRDNRVERATERITNLEDSVKKANK